jgi:anti-sigma B factor antagonist
MSGEEPGRRAPAPSTFWCRARTHADWHIVELGGDLDWTDAAEVRAVLCHLKLPRRGRLAMDMRGLTFMDSTGIRLLLHGLGIAEERGARYAVIRGIPMVQGVLELVGLDEQLRIVDDLEALD